MATAIPAQRRNASSINPADLDHNVGHLGTRRVIRILEQQIESMEQSLRSGRRCLHSRDIEYREFFTEMMKTAWVPAGVLFSPIIATLLYGAFSGAVVFGVLAGLASREAEGGAAGGVFGGIVSGPLFVWKFTEEISAAYHTEIFLASFALTATPAAIGLAGYCIEPCYNVTSNTIAEGRHAYTAGKIRSLIKKLKAFESAPLEGSSLSLFLSERSVPSTVYQTVVSRMNMSQQLELRKQYISFSFEFFMQRFFTKESLHIINTIQNLNTLPNVSGAIYQLESSMKKDPTIWKEVVKALNPKNFENARTALIETGKKALTVSDNVILRLIDKLRSQIRFRIKVEGETPREVSVKRSSFMRYPFFKSMIDGRFAEGRQSTIEFPLEKEEKDGFDPLMRFIQTRKISLNKSLARSMFILSERFGVEEASILCYDYLIKNRGQYEPIEFLSSVFCCRKPSLDLISFLLKYGQTPSLVEKTQQLLQQDLLEAERGRNYSLLDHLLRIGLENDLKLDDFLSKGVRFLHPQNPKLLELLFKYNLPKTQKVLKNYLLSIARTDVTVLYNCAKIPSVLAEIENECISLINEMNFRQFWEYAKKNNQEHLKNACKEVLRASLNSSEIINLWAPGHLPGEFIEVLISSRNIAIVNFRQFWEYAKKSNQEHLKNACKEVLKASQNSSEIINLWGPGDLPEEFTEVLTSSRNEGSLDT